MQSTLSSVRSQISAKPSVRYKSSGRLTGIDLGAKAVKLVSSRWGRSQYIITHAHNLCWPSSNYADLELTVAALIQWLEEYADPEARNIALSLPADLVDQETVEVPAQIAESGWNSSALGNFAKGVLQELLGASASDAIFDGWVSSNGGTSKLHLIWTNRQYVHKLSQQLAKANWFCRSIEAAPSALVRSASFNTRQDTSQLLVDLSGTTASFMWSVSGVPHYGRWKIQLGEMTPAELVAAKLKIRPIEAEVLLETTGLRTSHSQVENALSNKLTSGLSDYLAMLNYEIGRTRQYLHRLQTAKPLQEMVLSGGVSCIQGLPQWLGEQFDLKVRLMDIPEHWSWNAAVPYSAQFAVAASLANPEILT